MAWMVILLGLLAYGSGQGPGLCTLWPPPTRVLGHLIAITTPFSLLSLLGVEAQTVIQEPSLSVSPEGTVTLTCGLRSGSVTSWFQQTPGQAPRTVIYSTNSRLPGVPAPFSGSMSGNKAALTIMGVQSGDEADYHSVLHTVSYKATGMQPHGEALPKPALVLRGLSASRRKRLEMLRERVEMLSSPWGRGSGLPSPSSGSWPRTCSCLSSGVSSSLWGPLAAHNDAEGNQVHLLSTTLRVRVPSTTSRTLLADVDDEP